MWFKFPQGTSAFSCQQQNFKVEAEDDKGQYFRAPAHFAPIILAIPGFSPASQPEGGPDDLPMADPVRDGEIANMGTELSSTREALQTTQADLIAANAKLRAAETQVDSLEADLLKAHTRIGQLEEQLEEMTDAAPTPAAGGNKK